MKIFITVIRNKSKILIALCSLALFGIFVIYSFKFVSVQIKGCSYDVSVRRIINLCDQYSQNEIFGNMCPLLCQRFQLIECLEKGSGKHAFLMECKGCLNQGNISRIVMKRGYRPPNRNSLKIAALTNMTDKLVQVKKLVISMAERRCGGVISEDTDTIRYILGDDVHELIKVQRSDTIIDRALNLVLTQVQMEEFLSLKVLGPQHFLPKFYGICGDSYFVEYTPSLLSQNYTIDNIPDNRNKHFESRSWKDRVKLAIQFLDFVLEVENSYEYPMHMCDIKAENFGINAQGDLIFLDSDSIRCNVVIPPRKCNLNKQCHNLMCRGYCNQTTNTCSPYVVSSNLQGICRSLFTDRWRHLGLLHHAPYAIRAEFAEIIHECSHPKIKIFKLSAENRSDKKVLFDLKSILRKSLRLV